MTLNDSVQHGYHWDLPVMFILPTEGGRGMHNTLDGSAQHRYHRYLPGMFVSRLPKPGRIDMTFDDSAQDEYHEYLPGMSILPIEGGRETKDDQQSIALLPGWCQYRPFTSGVVLWKPASVA